MRTSRAILSAKIVVFILILSAFPGWSQEKVKFPVGASSKTLGYGPLWVAWKQGFFDPRQGKSRAEFRARLFRRLTKTKF